MKSRGFTLLEVMVALAILAIALAASVRSVGEQARARDLLRDDSYARWVAANLIAETRISEGFPCREPAKDRVAWPIASGAGD